MKAIYTTCLFLLISFFSVNNTFCQSVNDQSIKEAVILYNGKPFKVKLRSDGEIVQFIKQLPDSYLGKYQKDIDQLVEAYTYPEETTTSRPIITQVSSASYNSYTTEIPDSGPYNPSSSNNSSSTFEIYGNQMGLLFDYRMSIFKEDHFRILDDIISRYNSGLISGVMITPVISNTGNVNRVLARNRSTACKDYLRIKGIPEELIQMNGERIEASSTTHIILETY